MVVKKRKSHRTKGDVFDDIGLSTDESNIAKIKFAVLNEILKIVKRKKYTQRILQNMLDIPQPRVSELLTGKISKTSIEKLLCYLEKLGKRVSITFKDAA